MTVTLITLVFISIGFCLLSCLSDIDALKKQRDLLKAENLQLKATNTLLRDRIFKIDLEKMYKEPEKPKENKRTINIYGNFSIEESETLKKALKIAMKEYHPDNKGESGRTQFEKFNNLYKKM